MANFWLKLNQRVSSPDQSKAGLGLKLKKPIITLAPMYDVTDSAFRQIVAGFCPRSPKSDFRGVRSPTSGKPVFFTEFVSADGLASEAGRAKLLRELYFTKTERPIVAQIFGAKPETIKKAVAIIRELGFDGVDINMGCPDKAVNKIGAGASLIKTPMLAREIILAAKAGAPNLPISIKTRIGWGQPNQKEFTKWFKGILEMKPAVITVHFR